LDIPGVPVAVTVKQWGASASEIRHEVVMPPITLICTAPPGAEGIRGLVSTTDLEASQAWSSEPDTVSPGDALTRTVELSAEDVPGMLLPPMQHPEVPGLRAYPGEPSVDNETARGSLRGSRVETVTYLFEHPGEVELPGVVYTWWDVDDEVLRTAELPGLSLRVEGEIGPPPAADEEVPAESPPRARYQVWLGLTIALALGLVLARALVGRARRWLRSRAESEAASFRRVKRTLRTGDPGKSYAAILQWLDRLDSGTRPARLDLWLNEHGDAEAREAVADLGRSLAAARALESGRALIQGLARARRRCLRLRRLETRVAKVLPELN
jgi:hypothetical protein